MIDGPLFSYFGAKWSLAPRYPGPLHRTIVEPFAGSACYALRHAERDVLLVERDPYVAGVWRYLLGATEREILALPDIAPGTTVDEYDIPQEARWFVGFWLNAATVHPCKSPSKWALHATDRSQLYWGSRVRARVARALRSIRHWRIIEGDYTEAPDVVATWFVDPPYQGAGKAYRQSARAIDFGALGAWCMSRRGQTIVCENIGADWLPFRPFAAIKGARDRSTRPGKKSTEALWTSGDGQIDLPFVGGVQ